MRPRKPPPTYSEKNLAFLGSVAEEEEEEDRKMRGWQTDLNKNALIDERRHKSDAIASNNQFLIW